MTMKHTVTCQVSGCSNKARAKGLCNMHYLRYKATGNPGEAERRHLIGDLEGRLAQKVNKNGPLPTYRPDLGPCWIWTATTSADGYGMIGHNGKLRGAHRVMYEQQVGPIPPGLHLDHLCRTRNCVNPAHLEPVTNAENKRRAAEAKTHCKNGHELTPENVIHYPHRPGTRICRICERENSERQVARIKAERAARRQQRKANPPTHCIHGHEFTPDNTIIQRNGSRACRSCQRQHNRYYKLRQRERNSQKE